MAKSYLLIVYGCPQYDFNRIILLHRGGEVKYVFGTPHGPLWPSTSKIANCRQEKLGTIFENVTVFQIFKGNLTVLNSTTTKNEISWYRQKIFGPLPPKFGDDVCLHEYQAAAMQCCIKKMLLHKKWNFHSNYLDDAELCVLMSFTHKVFLCLIILCQSSC